LASDGRQSRRRSPCTVFRAWGLPLPFCGLAVFFAVGSSALPRGGSFPPNIFALRWFIVPIFREKFRKTLGKNNSSAIYSLAAADTGCCHSHCCGSDGFMAKLAKLNPKTPAVMPCSSRKSNINSVSPFFKDSICSNFK